MDNLIVQRATIDDAEIIHSMQIEAFMPLLKKYNDVMTNPANEGLEMTKARLSQKQSFYYLLLFGTTTVGAIRIVRKENQRYRLSPIFVLPAFQGKGFAKMAIQIVEELHADAVSWELETIAEEEKLCRLYESLGYISTGQLKVVTNHMNLVKYEKSRI